MPGINPDAFMDSIRTQFVMSGTPTTAWGNAVSLYSQLPGLRSYYPGGVIDKANGPIYYMTDVVNGFNLTAVATSTTYPRVATQGLASIMYYDDSVYHYYSDDIHFEVGADATNEPDIGANDRGITFGAWVRPEDVGGANIEGIIAKYNTTGNQRAYSIRLDNSPARFDFIYSDDGTNTEIQSSSVTPSNSNWYLVIARFKAAATQKKSIMVNNTFDETDSPTLTSINAAGTAQFEVGRTEQNNSNLFNGYMAHIFICAAYVPDTIVRALYHHTRYLFGV